MADAKSDRPKIQMTQGKTAPWSDHRSGMLIQFGVSGELTGSENVFMTRQKIPPSMKSIPHYHVNCETAMYISQGPVIMKHGDKLEHAHEAVTGDFLHIPQNAIHQIINPSDSADAEVVLCRDASEELVKDLPELDLES
ncbi:MAG TPA: cupin domain-containing protein [Dehalococcoidia bacterium]|nr:cupin domain-containing protein [Dehalococcoidia bacterium]